LKSYSANGQWYESKLATSDGYIYNKYRIKHKNNVI
jgi:hypothetical protein